MSKGKILNNSTFYSSKKVSAVDHSSQSTPIERSQEMKYPQFSLDRIPSKISVRRASSILSKHSEEHSQTKRKIKWNSSAASWTRQVSPSFGIPRAKRFMEPGVSQPPLLFEFKAHLNFTSKKGIKFGKDTRPQLFPFYDYPSPHQHNCKRYLETGQRRRFLTSSSPNPAAKSDRSNHIKGGAIGKFNNHWACFYPHTDRRLYNQRILKQAEDQKKAYKISKRK